jgi:hypothetical protein
MDIIVSLVVAVLGTVLGTVIADRINFWLRGRR